MRSTRSVAAPLLLVALAPFSALLAGACSDGEAGPSSGPAATSTAITIAPPPGLAGPAEWNRPITPLPADEARRQRGACAFKAGALPAESLGDQARTPDKIPIEHIVLVMMENRSFDHYFQKLRAAGVADVDVAPDDFSNTSSLGKAEPIHPMETYCVNDVNHGWAGVHEQVGGGKMAGFVTSNESSGDGARAMGYLTEETAPFGYFLAKNFALSDRHFCSLQGPTWPNRMFFYAASSFGLTSNTFAKEVEPTLMNQLDQRGVEWRVYKSNTPGAAVFTTLLFDHKENFHSIGDFYADAKAGNLPPVTYVDPELTGTENRQSSQHPPANHQYGEQFLYDVVKAVTESPLWPKTALFITYDEHGGFYDHVPPPKACPPDDRPVSEGADLGKFDAYGVRVPMYVISPYARKQYVSHTVTDHTSIVRFVEQKFYLPALTARDANAESVLDLFDFDHPAFMTPPALPARPELDAAKVEECTKLFP
jgi:phospholipase C